MEATIETSRRSEHLRIFTQRVVQHCVRRTASGSLLDGGIAVRMAHFFGGCGGFGRWTSARARAHNAIRRAEPLAKYPATSLTLLLAPRFLRAFCRTNEIPRWPLPCRDTSVPTVERVASCGAEGTRASPGAANDGIQNLCHQVLGDKVPLRMHATGRDAVRRRVQFLSDEIEVFLDSSRSLILRAASVVRAHCFGLRN